MLDWDDFRVFLSVTRAGTLSAAARLLQVDQSTISRRLAALEETAGARLFDRTPKGYALTVAGEAVRAHVEELEAQALAIERQLRGQDSQPTGQVRLAASDSFAAWFLLPRLAPFHSHYPGIQLDLVTGNQPVNLARREADISLRLSKPKEPNLIARKLGQAAWSVYASSAYLSRYGKPSVRGRLRGHRVVGFDAELRGTLGARWLAKHGNAASVSMTCNSLLTQSAAVVAGIGLSPLPCVFGDPEPSLERVVPRTIGHHDLWLVVHPDLRHNARVRAVMDYLTELILAETALLTGNSRAKR